MGEFLTPNVGANKIPETDYAQSRTWILRQKVSTLQRLTKELIGRYRSKRYFECVRNAQRNDGNSWDGVGILSSCGHTGPIDEVAAAASNFHCIDPTCLARVAPENIVLSDSLGVDSQSGTFGVKLETLVSLIKSETKKRDKILVFVQFNDLFDKVHEALGTYGISVAVLKGTASAKSYALRLPASLVLFHADLLAPSRSTVLQNFQDVKNSSAQVLLLLVTDSSASGECRYLQARSVTWSLTLVLTTIDRCQFDGGANCLLRLASAHRLAPAIQGFRDSGYRSSPSVSGALHNQWRFFAHLTCEIVTVRPARSRSSGFSLPRPWTSRSLKSAPGSRWTM